MTLRIKLEETKGRVKSIEKKFYFYQYTKYVSKYSISTFSSIYNNNNDHYSKEINIHISKCLCMKMSLCALNINVLIKLKRLLRKCLNKSFSMRKYGIRKIFGEAC